MRKNLIKQPNGKYCICDYNGKIERYNLIEQDIINMYIEEAKACIGAAEQHYGNIISNTVNEYTGEANPISDATLKEMGFDDTYNELVKFIPRKPLHTVYSSCNFATYGNCPNCGGSVQDGMGYREEKCHNCGQMLKWGK